MHFLRHRIQISGNVRAFFALMTPPSMAVVYDQHGPPDTVTKSYSLSLCFHNLEDSIQVTDTEFVKIVCRIVQLPPVEIKQMMYVLKCLLLLLIHLTLTKFKV
ncbi:hypothetical protein HanIR_Chr11g0531941 [Helianthus annuus]|nr:hypothetical protein HanIR_Chr11g0531941 [Helianthus annuus]